ncbi:MAG TPA: metallophosphoesterase family protein [Acidimicrobiales bacterium]|nr:metallophosphoesterase family protein [Acidimicrobiales bacterium]
MATQIRRVGFLADTHSRKNDGSDVPEEVDRAFAGVDLIVHLGDVGKKAFISRLQTLAPVWVPDDERKGYQAFGSDEAAVKVVDVGGMQLGLAFNLAQPDKKITVGDDAIIFPDGPIEALMNRRFKQPVDLVAFGGTHRQLRQDHDGIVFFNPGSPTLPADKGDDADLGSVAVLDVAKGKASIDLVRLRAT